jgi:hypothetical protein
MRGGGIRDAVFNMPHSTCLMGVEPLTPDASRPTVACACDRGIEPIPDLEWAFLFLWYHGTGYTG